jgi:hypothetical protein
MALPLINLPANTWVCVNSSAAYLSGVRVIVESKTVNANVFLEFSDSNAVEPSGEVDTLVDRDRVYDVCDGESYLWLKCTTSKTEVEVSTITPSVAVVSVPDDLAKDESIQATNELLAAIENPTSETLISGTKWAKYEVATAFSGQTVGDIVFKVVDAVDGTTVWHDVDHNVIAAPASNDDVLQLTGLKLVAAEWQRNYGGVLQTKSPSFSMNVEDFGTVLISGEWA